MCEKAGKIVNAVVLHCTQDSSKPSIIIEIINSKHFPILILCLTFLSYSIIYYFFKTRQRINFSTQQNIQMQGDDDAENSHNIGR